MRLLVLGAGAIGGYFGGRIAESGADVTFLVRPRRRAQLEQDGLRITSPLGDLTLRVQTASADSLGAGYDLVLLTCKAYDLDSAMDAIAPAVTGGCVIVPMLNGMAHLERLDRRFGQDHVLGGACFVNAALRADGVIEHGDVLQRMTFGARNPNQAAGARAFADVLAKSKIDWVLSEDIEQDLWEKLVMLSVLAATTCLFRGNVREIIAAPGGREAVERALETNITIAAREGHPPRAEAIAFARSRLTDPVGTWSASMLRDLESGRPVESDHIVGWMLEKARKHGLDDTVLALAFTHLKAYEARRAAGRL